MRSHLVFVKYSEPSKDTQTFPHRRRTARLSGLLDKLYEKQANTDMRATDVRLRGRTYTIPFEDVWQSAMRVGGGGIVGWSIGRFDDSQGLIEALAKTPFLGFETEVHIQIGLDQIGQTRVDAVAVSRGDKGDWGRSKRRIGRFFRELDGDLCIQSDQVLDPSTHPAYEENS